MLTSSLHSPTHYECDNEAGKPHQFWILDFRLSEIEFGTRSQDLSFMHFFSPNRKSAIENLKLFDDLIRPEQHGLWNRQVECFRGLEIDDEFKLRRLLDG